ncbi:MAG: hypothetical protein NZM11_01935 [Anaerolineales bacterium]|nr:hypothetical protein [Anaerolineales bacterium]
MPARYDVDTLPFRVVAGQMALDEPPGMATFIAPRRAARGREKDTLLLCLTLRSRHTVESERYAELLNLAANVYFGSPGSVTAAARQALNAVNKNLLDGNLTAGLPGSKPMQASLIVAVLRQSDFYAVWCGPGTVMVAQGDLVQRAAAAGRPLGLSDTLDAHYFHTTLTLGAYLVLSDHANWREPSLNGLGKLATLSAAAERLKAAAAGDFTALLARLEPSGVVGSAEPPEPLPAEAAPPAVPVRLPLPALPRVSLAEWTGRLHPRTESRPATAPAAVAVDVADVAKADLAGAPPPARNGVNVAQHRQAEEPAAKPQAFLETEPPPLRSEPKAATEERARIDLSGVVANAQHGLRSFGRAFAVTLTEMARSFRRLLARILPEGMMQRDGLFVVPTSVQIGIALGFPPVVVAIALLIYAQIGQSQQFDEALQQAQLAISNGRHSPDPLAARPHWEAALQWIERAEMLKPGNPEIEQLRLEAQGRLDELTWTTRVTYTPLLPSGVGRDSRLTRVLPVGRDVYALDTMHNRVWRLAQNAVGVYAVDESFTCASGALGPLTFGPLIDIGVVPGPESDSVIALDSAGGLLYCRTGEPPLGSYLPAPDVGWVQPIGLELYSGSLYILDIGQNQLWQYQASGGLFTEAPRPYFGDVIYDLKDVTDFVIANGEVFLQRRDGRLSSCLRMAATDSGTCQETLPFNDPRPGYSSGERLADLTQPAGIIYDEPPEPSLFLINPANNGLYQLSLKLNFTRQFQPAKPLPASISALAIDANKRFYIAAGNNVYRGDRP